MFVKVNECEYLHKLECTHKQTLTKITHKIISKKVAFIFCKILPIVQLQCNVIGRTARTAVTHSLIHSFTQCRLLSVSAKRGNKQVQQPSERTNEQRPNNRTNNQQQTINTCFCHITWNRKWEMLCIVVAAVVGVIVA